MPSDLKPYSYLWEQKTTGWVLLKSPDLLGGHCIINELNGTLLHIDDQELHLSICHRMQEQGCKVIDSMPDTGLVRVDPIN